METDVIDITDIFHITLSEHLLDTERILFLHSALLQINNCHFYLNYIDKNIKTVNQDNTIGIILVKKDNKLVLEYSTDKRIYFRTYELI